MKIQNLLNLEESKVKEFINSFDNIVTDADGVLWTLHLQSVDGIRDTFTKLQHLKKNIHVVSNNTFLGLENLHQKLCKLIPNLPLENVITPTVAIISYLKSINFDKELFLLGTNAMKTDFLNAGFTLTSSGPEILDEFSVYKYIKDVDNISNIGAAIFDLDLNINYYKLTKFLNCVKNENVLYLTGVSEQETEIGNTSFFGPGILQNTFSELSKRTPIEFGKPMDGMKNYILKTLSHFDPTRTLFVGDTLYQDIKFGKDCGFRTLLVLTGVTGLTHLKNCSPTEIPDYYIPSLGHLSKYL